MNMNKKSIAFLLISIIITSIVVIMFYPHTPSTPEDHQEQQDDIDNGQQNNTISPPAEPILLDDVFLFDQQTEKLDAEVIQYKITFHDDDTLIYNMDIDYTLSNAGSVFYLIYLTNGTTTDTLHLSGESSGRLLDLTTFRKHRMMGKHGVISDNVTKSDSVSVKRNETWYLTVAVATSINETLTVLLSTMRKTMEITPLLRNNNVTISSANNAEYKNGNILTRYRGASMLGIGYSLCYVDTSFPVTHGGIICSDMRNHIQGTVYIGNSISEIYRNGLSGKAQETSVLMASTDAKGISYWKVHAEALSFPTKISLLTMVVDVYPYSSVDENDWNGTHVKTITEKMMIRNKLRLQTIWAIIQPVLLKLLNITLLILMKNKDVRLERRQVIVEWIFSKLSRGTS